MKTPPKKHIHVLDMMRGMAMLLVVADHCGMGLPPVLDYFEVPVFFIISGILISGSTPLWQFVKNKAHRIVVPFVVYSAAFVALCWMTLPETLSLKNIIFKFVQPANYPLWFLKSLFIALLIEKCFIDMGLLSSLPRALAVIAAQWTISVALTFVPMHDLILITGIPQAVAALPIMSAGYIFGRSLADISFKPLLMFAVAMALTALSLFVIRGNIQMHIYDLGPHPVLFLPYSLLSYLCFFLLFRSLELAHDTIKRVLSVVTTPLKYIGTNSLEIFCVHAFPIAWLEYAGIDNIPALFVTATTVSLLWVFITKVLRRRSR